MDGRYLDLSEAIKNDGSFDVIFNSLERNKGLDKTEIAKIRQFNIMRKTFDCECAIDNGSALFIAHDEKEEGLHVDSPHIACTVSYTTKSVHIKGCGKQGDRIEIEFYPTNFFYKKVTDLFETYGYGSWVKRNLTPKYTSYCNYLDESIADELEYPDDNAFNETSSDKEQPHLTVFHNTGLINNILRVLIREKGVIKKDTEKLKQFVEDIQSYTDMYCLLFDNNIQIWCTVENGKIKRGYEIQTISIFFDIEMMAITSSMCENHRVMLPKRCVEFIVNLLKEKGYRGD